VKAVRAKRVLRAVTIVCRETEGRETEFASPLCVEEVKRTAYLLS
jgi:hypothetical protein